MNVFRSALALSLLCGCAAEPPSSESEEATPRQEPIPGHVNVSGTAPRASGGFPSVVIFEPVDETEFPVPTEPALMDQYGIQFHPEILIVRVGQPVEFRNSEDELHNVHVINVETRETLFNVATPVVGSYTYTFETPGAYDAACHTHPAMAAFIIATTTPYAVVADDDGTFSLPGLPAGSYNIEVWNVDRSRRSKRVLEIDEGHKELTLAPSD